MNGSGPWPRRLVLLLAIVCGGLLCALAVSATRTARLRSQLRQAEEEVTRLNAPRANAGQERVAQLEKLVAEQAAAYEKLRSHPPASAPGAQAEPTPAAVGEPVPGADPSTNVNRGAWLERLRQTDPVRYSQIQEVLKQRRQAVDPLFQKQLARLDERLQTVPTEDEATLVNNLADTLSHLDELRQQWQQARELPDDQRRATMQELGPDTAQTFQKLTQLRTQDRQLQLQQLAGQVGYQSGSDAGQFIDAVNRIIDETDATPARALGFRGWGRPGGAPPPAP